MTLYVYKSVSCFTNAIDEDLSSLLAELPELDNAMVFWCMKVEPSLWQSE